MSAIAIIGAGGFVGSSLIESLVLAGESDRVRAVVRSYRNMAGFCRYGECIDVRLADAEDETALAAALEGVATVVNVTTGPPAGIVKSTRAIHGACRRARVSRFVHLSSAVVYGEVERAIGDDEPPLARHWMPYARAKAEAEVWLRDRAAQDLDVVVLRPGIVWGVRSPHTLGFAHALTRKASFLVDGGRGIFNGVFIGNLVAAIRAVADHREPVRGFYNVGDAETVSWRQFYEALGAPLGCDAAHLPAVSGEKFPWSLSAAIDVVQSLPLVNETYHKLKTHIPDGVKAAIRARLEGAYSYERHASRYQGEPAVDRELWHLQRVRHKLPIGKFGNKFRFAVPVTFADGVRRTVSWLDTLGLTAGEQLRRAG